MAKILIVEDDKVAATAIAKELVGQGHVCAVQNAAKGVVDMAKKAPPDLMVLDIMLPDISGFEVCRAFRREHELYTVPILIISAMHDEEEVNHGLAQGADDYVTKPFEMKSLMQRIDTLLEASAKATYVDPLTLLPDAEAIRREMQRRISKSESFAIVYVEFLNLRDFGRLVNAGGREKAVRHISRALKHTGESSIGEGFFIGHMGGGHFVCLMNKERARKFCEKANTMWGEHVGGLYESLGQGSVYNEEIEKDGGQKSLLMPLYYITERDSKDDLTSHHLLEIVSRMRNNTAEKVGGKIHIDRRI